MQRHTSTAIHLRNAILFFTPQNVFNSCSYFADKVIVYNTYVLGAALSTSTTGLMPSPLALNKNVIMYHFIKFGVFFFIAWENYIQSGVK